MTQNRTAEMFRWGLIGSGLLAVSIVVGLPFGAEGVAASFAISGIAIRMPALFWAVGREGPVRSLDIVKTMVPSMVASGFVIASVLALRHAHAFDTVALGSALALAGFVTMIVTFICFAALPQSRRALVDFRTMSSALFQRRAHA
jgi:PST family polysaccharide transporter